MSPERSNRLRRLAAPRIWLLAALLLIVSGIVLGANLVLLGYAQPRDDPVGQLTPAHLMQIERSIQNGSATTAREQSPPSVDDDEAAEREHVGGEDSDD